MYPDRIIFSFAFHLFVNKQLELLFLWLLLLFALFIFGSYNEAILYNYCFEEIPFDLLINELFY